MLEQQKIRAIASKYSIAKKHGKTIEVAKTIAASKVHAIEEKFQDPDDKIRTTQTKRNLQPDPKERSYTEVIRNHKRKMKREEFKIKIKRVVETKTGENLPQLIKV